MSLAQSLLPGPPRPPHDPTYRLLNHRIGWGEGADLDSGKVRIDRWGELLLASDVDLVTVLGDPGLGGLVLPWNVALGPGETIYLLDPSAARLKKFDPCTCSFQTVPCLGGHGSAARQLLHPRGILVHCDRLYISDTGNHRVTVLLLPSFSQRDFLEPPPQEVDQEWEPTALATDSEGHLLVADPANRAVHRFHRTTGDWLGSSPDFGGVTTILKTLDNRILVATNAGGLFDIQDPLTPIDLGFDDLWELLPALPLTADTAGNLDLHSLCVPRGTGGAVFDWLGQPIPAAEVSGFQPSFHLEGTFISEAQDSGIYRCRWHRIILRGQLPAGTLVRVSTWTNESLRSTDFVKNLDDREWKTNQIAEDLDNWDCLVSSEPGRYLWLKIDLLGNGAETPSIRDVRIEFPRISLRNQMPAVYGEDPVAADFTDRFLSLFDTTLRSFEDTVDQQASLFDPLAAPAESTGSGQIDFLSWLGSWIGVVPARQLSEDKRRQLLKNAARLFHLRGTPNGLWEQLLLHLGISAAELCCLEDQPRITCRPEPTSCLPEHPSSCQWQPPPLILEHFQLRRWLFLGCGRLGEQAFLWGDRIVNRSQLDVTAQTQRTKILTVPDPFRDPFHVHAHKFSVFLPARLLRSDRARKGLETLIENEKPAHTQYQLVPVSPGFRLGVQSMIGLDSVIGCTRKEHILLNASRLRESSLPDSADPKTRIGESLRMGTTRLS